MSKRTDNCDEKIWKFLKPVAHLRVEVFLYILDIMKQLYSPQSCCRSLCGVFVKVKAEQKVTKSEELHPVARTVCVRLGVSQAISK